MIRMVRFRTVSDFRLSQALNTTGPILVTVAGITTFSRAEAVAKVPSPMLVKVEGKLICFRHVRFAKSFVTDEPVIPSPITNFSICGINVAQGGLSPALYSLASHVMLPSPLTVSVFVFLSKTQRILLLPTMRPLLADVASSNATKLIFCISPSGRLVFCH